MKPKDNTDEDVERLDAGGSPVPTGKRFESVIKPHNSSEENSQCSHNGITGMIIPDEAREFKCPDCGTDIVKEKWVVGEVKKARLSERALILKAWNTLSLIEFNKFMKEKELKENVQ